MVCEGDARHPDRAFSGIPNSILMELQRLGHEIETIDCELYGWRRGLVAVQVWSPKERTWRARFRLSQPAVRARSSLARRGFAGVRDKTDLVLQFGATFEPPGDGAIPYALYCDWNMALAIQQTGSGVSPALHLDPREAYEISERERSIYRGAAAIFTMSERLREAFIRDYAIPPERVLAVHAGPNIDPNRIPPPLKDRPGDTPPTIVFVGRDFVRKGGTTLLEAFRLVRRELPAARLVIVGPDSVPPEEGVTVLGLLRRAVPDEWQRLVDAYHQAHVFCLPTRYEPFGIVVVEAMFFGLPCVTSDTWAMSEMVVDSETGFTVPALDAAGFASRLLRLLRDPSLARRMGEAGRARAWERFTWTAAVAKMHDRIESIVAKRGG
jgi:glycosyltransferase involved in cell wall biosynthesis